MHPDDYPFIEVPLDTMRNQGRVYLMVPADVGKVRNFLREKFDLDGPERDGWDGLCVFFSELDEKTGCPTAVIALRQWDDNPDSFAVLTHECFHAAEWFLKQIGKEPPENWMNRQPESGSREAWEDAAYLLQGIVRRILPHLKESD